MKKLYCILICLLAFKVGAQTEPAGLFDMTDESIFGESTEQVFTGKPVVLIEKQVQPQKQVNKAELLPPPNFKGTPLNIPIKTLWGHDRTAAFVDHTTDFLVMIQVLDDQTVRVTEQIQFITTKDGEKFKRFFPDRITFNNEETLIKPEFLSLKRDNSFVGFEEKKTDKGIEITLDTPLSKGVHRMTLVYQLSNPFKSNRSLAEIILPITGPNWGQQIERFVVLVIMPQKTRLYEKEFLFGTNNQKIPENTKISEDEKGTLTLQNTHLLPAFADIRLHLMMDAKDLPGAPKAENSNLMIILLFTLVLTGYTLLSILEARLKKWKKPLAISKKINPLLWAHEIGEDFNDYQNALIQKTEPPIRFANQGDIILKILTFLRFNCEYILGSVLLILASKYIVRYYGMNLTGGIYLLFLILSAGAVFVIDYYGTRAKMKHLKEALKNALINEPQGLNLAKREIPTYYQRALTLGFHEIWKKRLIANNPSYKDLTCFEKEK